MVSRKTEATVIILKGASNSEKLLHIDNNKL